MRSMLIPAACILCLCVFPAATGCSSTPPGGGAWLIAVGDDTLTVADAAEAWNALDQGQREVFLSEGGAASGFVVSLARKDILLRELESEGYLASPDIAAFGESWLRIEAAIAALGMLLDDFRENVTGEDIRLYRDNLGTAYWFSLSPGGTYEGRFGPVNRAQLTEEMAAHLDTLSRGEYGMDGTGSPVRLDSIETVDPILVAQMLEDTAMVTETAVSVIAQSRFDRWRLETLYRIRDEYSVLVDSVALRECAASFPGSYCDTSTTILIHSDFRDWTVAEFGYEVAFLETRMPVQPGSPVWLGFIIDNLLIHSYLLGYLDEHAPEVLDSLRIESDAWIQKLAADSMYADRITANIVVTQEDLEEQYMLLAEPLMLEEKRIFETALIPPDEMAEFVRYDEDGRREELIAELQPMFRLAADTLNPRFSRPLRVLEFPAGLGDEAFLFDPADTVTWHGPYPLEDSGTHLLLRLAEVLPQREARMEEVLTDLEHFARIRLTEEAAVRWMLDLEEEYGVVINEAVLGSLSADPGEW